MVTVDPSTEAFVFDEPTRILVVDDDPLLLESAQVYLAAAGAKVQTAKGGNSALDLLGKNEFDVALVDIEMPGMGGFELVERIRAQHGQLPVVMLTVREDPASIDRAYAAGATSYVTKPVNWRQLAYQVQHVIRCSKLETGACTLAAGAETSGAAESLLARLTVQQDADKSRAIVFGILVVVGLTMTLLWAGPGRETKKLVHDLRPTVILQK